VRAIEGTGAQVYSFACDVSDEAALSRVLSSLADAAPPLAGVFHCAADLGAAPFAELSAEAIKRMLAPKVAGTVALERLCSAHGVEFLVLFSSTTALLGAAGLAHYAAANAFLDASAQTLREGPRMTSINWGTWEAMRLASEESRREYAEAGLEPMPVDTALELMGRVVGQGVTNVTLASIDWGRLKPLHEARRARPFLSAVDRPDTATPAPAVSGTDFSERLLGASPDEREELLIDFVRSEVAAVLATPDDEVPPLDVGLFDLGMDSLMSVELKKRLERGAGRRLPSTLTFNYPNIRALAGYLTALFAEEDQAPGAQPEAAQDDALVAGPTEEKLSDAEVEKRLRALIEGAD